MTIDSVNAALAFALASYDTQAALETTTTVVRNAPTTGKIVKVERGPKATPIVSGIVKSNNSAPGPKSEPLPKAGEIDATTFLKSLASCGKRPNANNVPTFQGEQLKREDEMRLISSYIGWKAGELHGMQLENARRHAQLALKPVSAAQYKRGSSNTISGFVSGMPDNQQKLVQDLLAREQEAANAICKHKATIENEVVGSMGHTLALGLLALEEERVKVIRKDLQANGIV